MALQFDVELEDKPGQLDWIIGELGELSDATYHSFSASICPKQPSIFKLIPVQPEAVKEKLDTLGVPYSASAAVAKSLVDPKQLLYFLSSAAKNGISLKSLLSVPTGFSHRRIGIEVSPSAIHSDLLSAMPHEWQPTEEDCYIVRVDSRAGAAERVLSILDSNNVRLYSLSAHECNINYSYLELRTYEDSDSIPTILANASYECDVAKLISIVIPNSLGQLKQLAEYVSSQNINIVRITCAPLKRSLIGTNTWLVVDEKYADIIVKL